MMLERSGGRRGRFVLSGAVAAAFLSCATARAQDVGPAQARYDGHKAVHVTARTVGELRTTLALTDDVWTCSGAGVGSFDVRMSPEHYAAFAATGIPHRLFIEDIQAEDDARRAEIAFLRANPGDNPSFYDTYRTLAEISQYVQSLVDANPALAITWSAGQTLQGRDIVAVRITGPGDRTGRPVIALDACQHAREWISPMTAVYVIDQLLSRYGTDARIKRAVDAVEWVIVPLINADGYVYTWNTDRYWRKNRRPPPTGSSCWGIDTNRNWGYQWGLDIGSSPDPCSEVYRGPSAFSEPETRAVRDMLQSLPRLAAYIDFHSFGQLILEPWGYTPNPPPTQASLRLVSTAMASAIAGVSGQTYVYGPGYSTIYPTSGTSPDWVYGSLGRQAWTIELRPGSGGVGGFAPPSSEIFPTCQENFEAVMALADAVGPKLVFEFPDGAPIHVDSGQSATVRADVKPGMEAVQSGSVRLYWRVGTSGTPSWVAMTSLGGTSYQASLPGAPCGSVIQYVVQATAVSGTIVKYPAAGFSAPLQAESVSTYVAFEDDCEINRGWGVGGAGSSATAGIWVRNIPQATAAQPGADHTPPPGVYCYVTDHRAGTGVGQYDVDGGATILTSPVLDAVTAPGLTGMRAYLRYWRWFSNDRGAEPGTDPLLVQISGNNGATWTTLEEVKDSAGVWVRREFKIADFVTPTTQMRLRFTAADLLGDSVVEAAIDDVQLRIVGCPFCYADCNGDGALNLADFGCFQTKFATGQLYADCNGDGALNLADFGCFQTKFAVGCP
jgi:hypothetical protein